MVHYLDFGGLRTLVLNTHHEAQCWNLNKINGSVAMDTKRDPSLWPWWYSFTFLNLLHISHGTDCGKIPSAELPCDTVLASLLLFLRNRFCTADCLQASVLIRGVVMYVSSFFPFPPPINMKHKHGYYRSAKWWGCSELSNTVTVRGLSHSEHSVVSHVINSIWHSVHAWLLSCMSVCDSN